MEKSKTLNVLAYSLLLTGVLVDHQAIKTGLLAAALVFFLLDICQKEEN